MATDSASQTASGNEFRDRKRAELLQEVSEDAPSKETLFRRVYRGEASPRQCIKAHCLECCWMDEKAIRECSDPACPLWDLRPFLRPSKVEGQP